MEPTARRAPVFAYVLGLTLVAAMSTMHWYSSLVIVASQERVAVEVNIASRQLRLVQRIGNIIGDPGVYSFVTQRSSGEILSGCADLLERAHAAFLSHDIEIQQASAAEGDRCDAGSAAAYPVGELSETLHTIVYGGEDSLDALLKDFLAQVRYYVESGTPDEILEHKIRSIAFGELSGKLNELVSFLQRDGEQGVTDLRKFKTGMWIATLLLLIAEVFLIFRPMTKAIRSSVDDLRATVDRLGTSERELRAANKTIMESITSARRIQESTLPSLEKLNGSVAELGVLWAPLQTVSGDYIWVEERNGTVVVFLADCTGHGVPGALVTIVVSMALETVLEDDPLTDPGAILLKLHREVRRRLRQDLGEETDFGASGPDNGLEAGLCLCDRRTGEVLYAGAGISLVVSGDEGVQEIKPDRYLLGYRNLRTPDRFSVHGFTVKPNDVLYLYSDGVPDNVGGSPAMAFGKKRLKQVIARHAALPVSQQLEKIEAALESYRGAQSQRDDMTVIAVRPLPNANDDVNPEVTTVRYAGD